MKQLDRKSGTAYLYELVAEMGQYEDRINLGIGDPDFDTPQHIVDATRDALGRDGAEYSPVEGLIDLRIAVSERVKRINDIDVDPHTEVLITNGGQEAVFLMLQAFLEPGDEIIMPAPNYHSYYDGIEFAGARKVEVITHAEEDFRVFPERIAERITDRTRAIAFVSPNNPTGAVISPEDTLEICRIAQEHDLILLADDIYDMYTYYGARHTSPASLPGMKERTVTLNAVSKSYAMCGWRCGWIVGPASMIDVLKRRKAAMSGPCSVASQRGALAALAGSQDCIGDMREAYERRGRVVTDALDEIGVPYGTPYGGQYVFFDITPTGYSSAEVAKRILSDAHVLVYPGFAFDDDRFMRITFLQSEEVLREAMERVKKAMEGLL